MQYKQRSAEVCAAAMHSDNSRLLIKLCKLCFKAIRFGRLSVGVSLVTNSGIAATTGINRRQKGSVYSMTNLRFASSSRTSNARPREPQTIENVGTKIRQAALALQSHLDKLKLWLHIAAPIVSVGLSACVPYPHMVQTKSEIDGVITVNGSPLIGANISYCAGGQKTNPCEGFTGVITDASGTFHIAGERSLEAFTVIGGNVPGQRYVFEIHMSHNERRLNWIYFGNGYRPKHIFLRCEVAEKFSCSRDQ